MAVNDRLIASTLRHQVGMERVTASTVRELIKLLDAADVDLLAQIKRRLRAITDRGFDTGPWTTRRLESLLTEVRTMNRDAYVRMGRFLRKELRDLADYEIDFQENMLADSMGATLRADASKAAVKVAKDGGLRLSLLRPPGNQLVAAIEKTPFQGAIMARWVEKLPADKTDRVMREIHLGLVEGQNTEQIVRRLVGTRAAGYKDGVLEIGRKHATTWTRTYTAGVANEARDAMYEANSDVLAGVTWVATLDPRTCFQCVPYDGHLYSLPDHRPLDGGPQWGAGPGRLHPNDRCTSIGQIRTWRQLGIPVDEVEDPDAMRAAFGGPVSRKVTAEQWLRGNPDAARDLYGDTRAKLFLDGGVSAEDLIRKDGTLWSLSDLRSREVEAFRKAGLLA